MIIFQVPSPTPEDYQTSFDPNDIDFMNTFFSNALPDSKEDASYEVKKKELYDRYVPLVVNTSRSFPHSRLISRFVTRLTWQVPLVEQELLTLPEYLSSPPIFSGIRVTRSLVLCVCFVDRCLSFCLFSFGHCFVCSSSIYRFCLPLWYLQTLHSKLYCEKLNFKFQI